MKDQGFAEDTLTSFILDDHHAGHLVIDYGAEGTFFPQIHEISYMVIGEVT